MSTQAKIAAGSAHRVRPRKRSLWLNGEEVGTPGEKQANYQGDLSRAEWVLAHFRRAAVERKC